jgi:hypothetical protein
VIKDAVAAYLVEHPPIVRATSETPGKNNLQGGAIVGVLSALASRF